MIVVPFVGIRRFVTRRGVRATTFVSMLLLVAVEASADFLDVSQIAGFVQNDFTYGQAWGDLDGDNDPDLVVGRHFAPPVIYRNLGDGTFSSFTPVSFVSGDHHGMVVADFDNDGDPDIYLTGGAIGGTGGLQKFLFRNDGNLVFQDITSESGLTDDLGRGRSCSLMDVDGDGAVDLFVAKARRVNSPNSLFVNDGTGNFIDVAATSGLADALGSEGGIWGDYDHDGDPDLFVSGVEYPTSVSRLYRNDGNLTFTDILSTAIPGIGQGAAAAWGDYDNDNDLDLAVGLGDGGLFDGFRIDSDGQSIAFFFNARAGDNGVDGVDFTHPGLESVFDLQMQAEFTPDSIFISSTGFHPTTTPFTVTFSGITGRPDFVPGESVGLFLWTDLVNGIWKLRCSTPPGIGNNFSGLIAGDENFLTIAGVDLEAPTLGPRGARLYRNDGGVFVDVAASVGITDSLNVRNVTWIDFDLDGDLDLHVHNKGDTESANHPDVLYENQGGVFSDVTTAMGFAGPTEGLGDGISFEDYDGDGDPDAAITSGASPRFFALREIHRLYENRNTRGSFLRVDLEGVVSTRDGFGAWVTCVSSLSGRQVRYVAGNAWRGSQVMIDPLFGLGGDAIVDTLRVEWPSGLVSELTSVSPGSITVVEPAPVPVPETANAIPATFDVIAIPNPSMGGVVFRLSGARNETCTLDIIATTGRRVVRRTVRSQSSNGEIHWDGRDDDGRVLAAGVYHVLLREGSRRAMERVVLLR